VVQKLALSGNGLTDKAFGIILHGILAQKLQKSAKPMVMHSLVYSKNELGKESLQRLQPLLRDI
jgi:phosphoglycerate dehydrogenase-like enzyme